MNIILDTLISYAKPIITVIIAMLVVYLFYKFQSMKEELFNLKMVHEKEEKTINIENEIFQTIETNNPTDTDGIIKLMQEQKL